MQNAGAEFVKWIKVDRLKRDPIEFQFTADENERADLAKRLGILGLNSLDVKGVIKRKDGSKFLELSANMKAEAVQECVVSLEPVPQKIDVEFALCYTFDKEDTVPTEVEYVFSKDEVDLPELVEGGQIDVVQAASEQIALALDPYPRAEGASNSDSAKYLQQSEEDEQEGEPEQEFYKPFANLKDLMNKK
ncbi:YceD family protein [Sneathiella limimaris]|uniref:YceD family protein n=1 Tax=Sneathiella limimaris TaxID=1964213 RepID=UPI00146B387E|nr:DUF177 domain-containing protein [Sneathiella limimaris]